VCSTCLESVPARVVERDGRVLLRKSCATHGDEEAVLSSDRRLFWNAGAPDACGSGGCGCGISGHSCTLIFEITERCNLSCPACFAASSPHKGWRMSLAEFTAKLDRLAARGKGDADMVQFSGGEPTIHPDLERMIAVCFERGVRKVYVNTNGIRLGAEPDFAGRLAALDAGRDRLQLYLQFDGFEERTYHLLRGAKGMLSVKRRAIEHALAAGLFVLPVMTVARGVNDDEIGPVIRMMLDHHPRMNTVMLQPAFYAGRFDAPVAPQRLTMADVAHEAVRQTGGLFAVEDFGPIPCSHPNCFAMAVALVRGGRIIPISRYFPRYETWEQPGVGDFVRRFADRMPQHMLEHLADDATIDALLDLLAQDDDAVNWSDYRNFAVVGIKPFMDAHSYDQDRVDRCCVHVVDRSGEPVSLCEYNTIRRPLGRL
jgi:uncharacterized radical SAM superfamily Fe-S cluster-containing enzyme